jgi:hypothetical protein
MKTIKILLICILLSFFSFSFIQEGYTQSSRMKDKFYIGTINNFFQYYMRTTSHKQWYDSLSFNMMQNYCAHLDTTAAFCDNSQDGGFFQLLSEYEQSIYSVLADWWGISKNENSLLFEREKVLKAAYGQRSTYFTFRDWK